jgi:uncharacterized protein YecT (DUF1311 family)
MQMASRIFLFSLSFWASCNTGQAADTIINYGVVGPDASIGLSIDFSNEYHHCVQQAGGVDFIMGDFAVGECSLEEDARWDDRLNRAFKAIMASDSFSEHSKAELKDAQRAWINYRDTVCLANGDLEAEGGTLARVISSGCHLSMTAQRTVELEGLHSRHRNE